MKVLKLTSVLKTMAASMAMVASCAGASPILADSERSLEQIICSLYRVERTSCRQSFNGGDLGHSQLWAAAVIEASDRAELFSADRSVAGS